MPGPDLTPRGVGHVLDDAIAIYRGNFKRVAALAMVSVFPVALFYGITQTFYLRGLTDQFAAIVSAPSAPPQPLGPAVLIAYSLAALASTAYLVARVLFQSTLLRGGVSLLAGDPPPVKQMLKDGLGVFLPVFGVTMLISIVVSIAAGLSILALGAGGAVAAAYLAVAVPVAAVEQSGVFNALKRSFALVRGNFWRVVLVFLGMIVLSSQIEGALASPILIRDAVLAIQNPTTVVTQLPVAWKVAEGTLQAAAAVLVLPFIELTWFVCYLDLRARNEGLDLLVRAQELGSA
jgi:hypothetical protein